MKIRLFLYIFLFFLGSCAGIPQIQKGIPHFIFVHSVQTDVNLPLDIFVNGSYIFILDGADQTIKRYNGSKIQFGGFGTDKETFIKPVSIDGIKGCIFVLDKTEREVKIFDTDGNYISGFSVEIELPSGIVLDGFGRVYILDKVNFKVYIYTEEGKYVNKFGEYGWGEGFLHSPIGIAYNNQYLYVLDDKRVSIFDPDGNYIQEITLKRKGKDIAVDKYIYVLTDNGVFVYTNTGREAGKITGKWNKIYAKKGRIYLATRDKIDIYRTTK